jgi:hypothetical protein
MWIGFKGKENQTNSVILVGERGGAGVLEDPHIQEDLITEKEREFLHYLRGAVH